MNRQQLRREGFDRVRGQTALTAGVICLLASSGCAHSPTVERSVVGLREVRYPLKRGAPVLASEWRAESDEAVGKLDIAVCEHERSVTMLEVETEDNTAKQVLGGVAVMSGIGLGIAAFMVASQEPVTTCTIGSPPTGVDTGSPYDCKTEHPGRTEGALLIVSSVALATLGIYLAAAAPNQVEQRYNEDSNKRAPCLTAEDLETLTLALRVGPGRLVPVEIGRDGSARVKLANVADLPRDEDLRVVVVRVPAGAQRLLKRGQVVGHVRVPSEAPPPN